MEISQLYSSLQEHQQNQTSDLWNCKLTQKLNNNKRCICSYWFQCLVGISKNLQKFKSYGHLSTQVLQTLVNTRMFCNTIVRTRMCCKLLSALGCVVNTRNVCNPQGYVAVLCQQKDVFLSFINSFATALIRALTLDPTFTMSYHGHLNLTFRNKK